MVLSARRLDGLALVGAIALGIAACVVWAGPTLDPTNISWLKFGDRTMHSLGWWFFRGSPWSWPPGANPRNGLEIAGSVALSDSLPLFALPFKALSPWLPPVFQYWGFWFLTCMALQSAFGFLIGRALGLGRWVSLLLGACLLLTPAFLWRLPVHMALAGHWTILAALWLYIKPAAPRRFAWPLLLAITSAIHAYLLVMVLAIWAASLVERLWRGRMTRPDAAIEGVAGLAASLAVLWLAGFFMMSSLGAEGFGFYRMNLDALFDARGWSQFWPSLPSTAGEYEGLAFPGLGVLALLALGLVVAAPRLRALITPRWVPLVVAALLLALFAVSNRPELGPYALGTLPLPAPALDLAAMFRASGRMIWPLAYLLVPLAFVLIDRRLGARVLLVVAALAVVVQTVDTSRQWRRFASEQPAPASSWPTPLHSRFWQLAASHYKQIRAIPVRQLMPNWLDICYFAAFHGMATDAAYLGRLDQHGFGRLNHMADAALSTGAFDTDSVYVLGLPQATAMLAFVKPSDLFATADGFIVFARGGATLGEAAGLTPRPLYRPVIVPASAVTAVAATR